MSEKKTQESSAVIESLILDLGGKRVDLTIGQAKKLFGALDELFGEKTRTITIDRPYPVPTPCIPWHDPERKFAPWKWDRPPYEIICESGAEARFDPDANSVTLAIE